MTRKTSFYYSFLVLPKAKRDVIVAVWDFCRAVDDAVDLESDPVKAKAALDEWRREVGRVFGGAPLTRQGIALQTLAAPFSLPREQFDALIDGVAINWRYSSIKGGNFVFTVGGPWVRMYPYSCSNSE